MESYLIMLSLPLSLFMIWPQVDAVGGALILAGSPDGWLRFKLFQLINISDIASRIRASRNVNYFYGSDWCKSAPRSRGPYLLYDYEFIFRYLRPLSAVDREAAPASLMLLG